MAFKRIALPQDCFGAATREMFFTAEKSRYMRCTWTFLHPLRGNASWFKVRSFFDGAHSPIDPVVCPLPQPVDRCLLDDARSNRSGI